MKKLFSLLLVVFVLAGCSSKPVDIEKAPSKISEYVENSNSYKAVCEMEIYKEDKTIKFEVGVEYLSPDHYKVSFTNVQNNAEQIIVKNDTGVYALTPALGKEFKFESDWPLNGSHAYLLNMVIADMKNDEETSVKKDGNDIVITSKINHRTNHRLEYQELRLTDKYLPKSVGFYSEEKIEVKVTYISFIKDVNITKNDFMVDKIMEESVSMLGEGSVASVEGSLVVSYVVDGCTLKNKKIDSPVIMNYGGEKKYTIICQDVMDSDALAVTRIYNDFEITDIGVAFINQNSITVFFQNKEIMVLSDALTENEMIDIINSINFS